MEIWRALGRHVSKHGGDRSDVLFSGKFGTTGTSSFMGSTNFKPFADFKSGYWHISIYLCTHSGFVFPTEAVTPQVALRV